MKKLLIGAAMLLTFMQAPIALAAGVPADDQSIVDKLIAAAAANNQFQASSEMLVDSTTLGNDRVDVIRIDGEDDGGAITWFCILETKATGTEPLTCQYAQDTSNAS